MYVWISNVLASMGIKFGTSGGLDASSITSGTIDAARMYVAIDTYANIVANYASAPEGSKAVALDLGKSGVEVVKNGSNWIIANSLSADVRVFNMFGDSVILIGGSGATYSQTGTTVTVTWASHGISSLLNGCSVHLTQSTGLLATGIFTNFTYVDANTFTCTSSVSQTTSGNLGSNTAKTYIPTLYTFPDNLLIAGSLITWGVATLAKSNLNNKTFRADLGGYQVTADAIYTNGTTYASINNPSAVVMTSPTAFMMNGIGGFPVEQSIGDKTLKLSIQLANASDWALVRPQFVRLRS